MVQSCQNAAPQEKLNAENSITQIGLMIDSFHLAAATTDYIQYFNFYTPDATFLGTDATERWSKDSFAVWAKPFFDRGKAWSFTSVQRHIQIDESGQWAWFDEILDTQMKLCRGSGVVIYSEGTWRIRQYVLSMAIPNSTTSEVVRIKTNEEDSLLHTMRR